MNLDPSQSESSNPTSPNTPPTPYDHTSPLVNIFYELNEVNEDSNSSGNSNFYSQTLLPYSPPRNRPPSTSDSPLNPTDLPSRTLFSHLTILNKHQQPHLSSSSSSSAFNRSSPPRILPSTSRQSDSIPSSNINPQLLTSSSFTTPLLSSPLHLPPLLPHILISLTLFVTLRILSTLLTPFSTHVLFLTPLRQLYPP